MYRDTENWYKFEYERVGKYGFPTMESVHIEPQKAIPFNYAKGCKEPENSCVHFFLDDYQFDRVWRQPERYAEMLLRFHSVTTPDFSIYTDMPEILQMYNHYRKQWLGAYWQELGMQVIPTVSWSTEDSFKWCFDGIPKNSCVAVSSVGCMNNKNSKNGFIKGYEEMIRRLKPEIILFFGKKPEEISGNIVEMGSFQEQIRERSKKNGR